MYLGPSQTCMMGLFGNIGNGQKPLNVLAKNFIVKLKLTSHGVLYCFWSADLPKGLSQLIVSIFTFCNQ